MSGRATALIRSGWPEPCRPWPRAVLEAEGWAAMADALGEEPGLALLALWADNASVYALFVDQEAAAVLPVSTAVVGGAYAALSPHRPGAAWFERMVADLWGHQARGGCDSRPWLDHGQWGQVHPMALRPGAAIGTPEPPQFLAVEGEDLHQVPLGPMRAGILEPGHLRITARGETIAELEARLGYAHKGTLALLRGKSPRAAARFAARLSGDSTVAHSLAFAHAAEAALQTEAPPRAAALRAVMAELERVANHLGDTGAIGEAAGFAFAPARFGFHRERVLRASAIAFGHRLMMDLVVPGGVVADIAPSGAEAILRALAAVEAELGELERVWGDSASLADRVLGTGILDPGLAVRLAAGGYVGRASGRDMDARRWPGYAPYQTSGLAVPLRREGDVDARVRIRLFEIGESVRLLRALLGGLPDPPILTALPPASGEGIGVAEGFRGEIWHWLRLESGMIASAFLRDPSWALWPLIEAVMRGEDVADVPLCERSLNATCSGVDL